MDALEFDTVPEMLDEMEPAQPARRALPFTFATQHKVLLEDGEPPTLYHLQPLSVPLLAEMRRFLGGPFALRQVDEAQFQSHLTQLYQRSNNEASQVAEDLSGDLDLTRLADEIPEMGDLMDAEDDAPIIRLINAILS
ncbi:MAG: type II secretion system protein GspE, partial [Halieaceae bacterium]|nr:type II secretion system protein GspE [Halieaceae bacterium]